MTDKQIVRPHGFLGLAALLLVASLGFFGLAVVVESPQLKDPATWATGMTFLGSLASWLKAASKTTGQKVEENTSAVVAALNTQNELNKSLRSEMQALSEQLETKHEELLEIFQSMEATLARLQTSEEHSDVEIADLGGVLDNHGQHIVKIHEHLRIKDPTWEPGTVRQRDPSKTKPGR